jgi:hypothetical protein
MIDELLSTFRCFGWRWMDRLSISSHLGPRCFCLQAIRIDDITIVAQFKILPSLMIQDMLIDTESDEKKKKKEKRKERKKERKKA